MFGQILYNCITLYKDFLHRLFQIAESQLIKRHSTVDAISRFTADVSFGLENKK